MIKKRKQKHEYIVENGAKNNTGTYSFKCYLLKYYK